MREFFWCVSANTVDANGAVSLFLVFSPAARLARPELLHVGDGSGVQSQHFNLQQPRELPGVPIPGCQLLSDGHHHAVPTPEHPAPQRVPRGAAETAQRRQRRWGCGCCCPSLHTWPPLPEPTAALLGSRLSVLPVHLHSSSSDIQNATML